MVLRGVLALIFSLPRRLRGPQHQDAEVRLERCGVCGGDFVHLVEWQPAGPEHWRLLLRCGECETWCDVTVPNAVAQRYDAALDGCARDLATLVDRMDRERMLGQAEAITTALELGLIDAADFATGSGRRFRP